MGRDNSRCISISQMDLLGLCSNNSNNLVSVTSNNNCSIRLKPSPLSP